MDMIRAGASFIDITPKKPYFLFGYPFVERISSGVHDWLLSSALYLDDGNESVIFITNDIIYVDKSIVAHVREAVSEVTKVPVGQIMIGATHTHSGPVTVDCLNSANDPVVPSADPVYIRYLEQQMIRVACEAFGNAVPAKIGLTIADVTGIGTNRHDPAGPSDLNMPVLLVKDLKDEWIGCMMVCHMHPTVLHEDSTLYSGDFPAYAREILQKKVFGCQCPVLHFTGAAGNQSPRHVTQSNTFDEAFRLGGIIAEAVRKQLDTGVEYESSTAITCRQEWVDLPRQRFPDVESAKSIRDEAYNRFQSLRKTSGDAREIRTAEVDWFGAEELFSLSKLSSEGALEDAYRTSLPAEIQLIRIGTWRFVSWPGEIFTEYALALKSMFANTFLITLTNGELQGYIVTEEAWERKYYEAANTLFHHSAGEALLVKTAQSIKN
jgi:hypothetical protein